MSDIVAGVENLRLKFPGSESLLFKDYSLSFQKGEKVLLLGPSGCGKSTLLQVLSGIIPGSIEIPMKAEKLISPESWGYVFQDPETQFCMPFVDEEIAFVLENLQVPREEMKGRINSLLQEVGLSLEDNHTSINTLSGGMKQRLAIASVLALNPDVLFLDEPTAMLDPKGTIDIWETIKDVSADKTLLIVEHKIDHVLDLIDRIIVLDEHGNIIEDGPKEEVFVHNRQYFMDQGIWYPGVWEDYLSSRTIAADKREIGHELLTFKDFKGFRKKETKIEITEAVVHEGEWIVIVGDNGAGKSTCLHAMMQFIHTSGGYYFQNQQIDKLKELNQIMTFVFQNPEFQFVTNSVYEEMAYSLKIKHEDEALIGEKVEKSLHRFSLSRHKYQHPYQLSMGQKRRLSVAASIINEQPILLLDEPTFGQDSKNTFALLELLEAQRQLGTTIIMVTHDEMIASHFATRKWTIEAGYLVQDEHVYPNPKSQPVMQ
ncbi:ATP-binding cassette domain-containing protein [Bacillus timonensis]|nr:ATP-binding cassette domain-containing protein [Bacillus timonensis]